MSSSSSRVVTALLTPCIIALVVLLLFSAVTWSSRAPKLPFHVSPSSSSSSTRWSVLSYFGGSGNGFGGNSNSPWIEATPNGHVSMTRDCYVDVNVTYYVPNPSGCDKIGIFSPPSSHDTQLIDSEPVYGWSTGWVIIRLWNVRDDYEIRYLTCGGIAIAKSSIISMSHSAPCQGHIYLTENWNEMGLKWVSSPIQNAVIEYATTKEELNTSPRRAMATSTTYTAQDMCGSDASTTDPRYYRDPGRIYDAMMTGLAPWTKYYYRFGSATVTGPQAAGGMSEVFEFLTRGPPHAQSRAVKVVVFGDHGISKYPGGLTTGELINAEQNVDLVLHIGDISYARGKGHIWDAWSNLVSPIARTSPYMVSVGNHEYDHTEPVGGDMSARDPSGLPGIGFHPPWGNIGNDATGECGVPTAKRFSGPKNGNGIFWYSFDFGLAHFVMLSSEHDLDPGAVMHEWLVADLSSVDRRVTPWLIVNIHRPLYISENYYSDNVFAANLRRQIEAVLLKYRVDVVFAGHYHTYQRSCRVRNGNCTSDFAPGNERGIVHICIGSAGGPLDSAEWLRADWSDFKEQDYGYGRAVINATHLCWEYVRNRDGQVPDSVCIDK